MSENQAAKGKQSIIVEYELPDAPKKLWRALTEPKLLEAWLMPNDIRPVVGHHFNFRAQPVPGWDGTVYCEVLEVVPEQRLVYAWRGGAQKLQGYGHELDTVVTWDLAPTADGGTLLRLEHSGFDPDSFAFKAMGQGWRGKVGDRITQALSAAA
jgi:uncharacterized protein YndB with AHSA1/START domain